MHSFRMSGKSQTILLTVSPRPSQILATYKNSTHRYPRSFGMVRDKSGESGASLFSRCIQDFCDGWRSFPINENSNLYRRGRRQWISLFTNPLNIWASVPLSRKFQFLTHFPFPAKFNIGRIRDSLVESIQYIGKVWDSRQKVKSPIVQEFPNI